MLLKHLMKFIELFGFPLGVIDSKELLLLLLAPVSFRDFLSPLLSGYQLPLLSHAPITTLSNLLVPPPLTAPSHLGMVENSCALSSPCLQTQLKASL